MKFLILAALVACALADGHMSEGNHPEAELYDGERDHPKLELYGDKEPCCLPDQYHFKIATENGWKDGEGNTGWSKSFSESWVDYRAGKMAGFESKLEGDRLKNSSFVADFIEKHMLFYDHESNMCYMFDLPGALAGQCLTQKAELLGTYKVGAGESAIATDNWFAQAGKEGEWGMQMEVGVTADQCIPIFSNLEGKIGDYEFKTGSMYFDTYKQIPDASVFSAPEACKNPMKIDTPDEVSAMAFIQEQFFPETGAGRCCFPMAWEGKMNTQTGASIATGGGAFIEAYMPHVAVNYEYMKFAVTEYISMNGVPTMNVTYIGDMRYGVMYEYNIESKQCKKFNIPSVNSDKVAQCIPSSAEFRGSTMLGAQDGGTPVDSYRLMYGSEAINMTVDMAVTKMGDICVPLSELSVGINKDKTTFMSVSSFMNLKAGVEDPEVFHPPQECNGAEIEELPQEMVDTIDAMIKRFTNDY